MTPGSLCASHLAPVPFADPGSTLPDGWCAGPFMQIFPRAYQDGNGDGIGDLRGLISRLDYLQDLGIRGLWLMPIMRSADRDHGYATLHYRQVEPDYGTLADFDELLAQAHRRGIGVILDYVVNHSAATHPLFQQAASAADSPWRDWYLWSSPRPQGWDIHGHDPWIEAGSHAYFASFDARMPDFNLQREEVLEFHLANLRFWLNRGVDGIRFDAVPHLVKNGPHDWKDQPESRQLTRRLCEHVHRYTHRYVVCESTAKPWIYSSPEVGGSAFAFGLNKLVLRATAGAVDAIRDLCDNFVHAPATLATMLSNHDRIAGRRLWDETAGDLARYRLAAASYLLAPGIPFVYYGEEVGMSAAPGLSPDDALRAPMSWAAPGMDAGFTPGQPFRGAAANVSAQNVAVELARAGSLLGFYRALVRMRSRFPALARGRYAESFTCARLWGFQRRDAGQCVQVLLNFGDEPQRATLQRLPADTRFEPLLSWGDGPPPMPERRGAAFEITLPARSGTVQLLHGA